MALVAPEVLARWRSKAPSLTCGSLAVNGATTLVVSWRMAFAWGRGPLKSHVYLT